MAANAVSWRGKAIGQVIFLQDLKQKNMPRRILVMLLGIVVLGIGVGMFKLALLGNDPSTALVIAIGDRIGVDFSLVLIGEQMSMYDEDEEDDEDEEEYNDDMEPGDD